MRAPNVNAQSLFYRPPFWRWVGGLLCLTWMSGCANSGTSLTGSNSATSNEQLWVQSVVDYKNQLPVDHPDRLDAIFDVTPEMKNAVIEQFSGMSKHGAATSIARWLLDKHGRNMEYDVNANFTPTEAFTKRRGNCLSFTLLLHSLAKQLDIEIEFNSVEIPDTWGMDEGLGMIFYRHVNGVLEIYGRRQIFDLAMEVYNAGYPQKFMDKLQIMAMFMNNKAIGHLEKRDFDRALHAIKLGVSYDPKNSDLWVNFGVILKRQGEIERAEAAFLHAQKINHQSIVVVSNLERLYRQQGQPAKAAIYAKRAERARLANPYVHYHKAQMFYEKKQLKKAERATKRAIKLHDKDPRFYELKSLIAQQRKQYPKALKALEKAYLLSFGDEQRDKYASKAELVTQNAINEYKRQERKARIYKYIDVPSRTIYQ